MRILVRLGFEADSQETPEGTIEYFILLDSYTEDSCPESLSYEALAYDVRERVFRESLQRIWEKLFELQSYRQRDLPGQYRTRRSQ